jgi:hypothetical protein
MVFLLPAISDLAGFKNELRPGDASDTIIRRAKMTRHRVASVVLFFAIVAPGFCAVSFPAVADDVPESMRIEQKALKDYSQKPVVPIDRGNAHHRNSGGSGEDGASPEKLPDSALPDPVLPDVPAPPATQPAPNSGKSH